ncbi:hypothetical protein [Kiloniella sp.]|uniref:hypothetical protein n=1 Tax=Kiloniella sp. TaxID=1938587 RepID=UPI003A8D7D7D
MNLFKTISLGVILLAVAACQTTRPVPPGMYYDQQKYLTYGDHKAMVGAIGNHSAYTYGWAWNHPNIDDAIVTAQEGCEKNMNSAGMQAECKVHFIGNQNVMSLSPEELKVAIKNYKAGRRVGDNANTDWHLDIAGVYQGKLINNNISDSITTTFTLTAENKITGTYEFENSGAIQFGNLTNCFPNQTRVLTCTWQDSNSTGDFDFKFNNVLDGFRGPWGDEETGPYTYWSGKKQ